MQDIQTYISMGVAFRANGKFNEAIAVDKHAIALSPNNPQLYVNLAKSFIAVGDLEAVISCYKKALSLKPNKKVHASLLVALHYQLNDPQKLLHESELWATKYCGNPVYKPCEFDSPKNRKLRIGYSSGSLVDHPEGKFLRSILSCIDCHKFDVFVYNSTPSCDELTAELHKLVDNWRDITKLNDFNAAELIRKDRIDILTDLSGHFANNRLSMFTYKPAKIQVIHYGYPGTSGLEQIDWRITDKKSDINENLSSEKFWYLDCYQSCYKPDYHGISLREDKPITFISPNNPLKITLETIKIWAKILLTVPNANLELLAEGESENHHFYRKFAQHGIDIKRIKLVSRYKRSKDQYFKWLQSADVCLDTWPFNGCQTTLDALWMGVPVVSLLGNTNWSRQGFAILNQVGLDSLVANTVDEYANIAITLSKDKVKLTRLRSDLREKMRNADICNCSKFVKKLEDAYISMVSSVAY